MSRPPGPFPSSNRPDDRYKAVVARGRMLRRRDRRRKVAVAGGTAVVLVVVLALGALAAVNAGGSGTEQSPVDRASTPTTAPGTPRTTSTDLTVAARREAGTLEVVVDEPALVSGGRICVQVALRAEGPARTAASEATTCWNPIEGPAATAAQMALGSVEIGCGAVAERPDEPSSTGVPSSTEVPSSAVRHGFRFTLPADAAPGAYVAEVTATSGSTDACATATPGDADRSATERVAVDVP